MIAGSSMLSISTSTDWFVFPPSSSVMVTVNISMPLKLASGTYSHAPDFASIVAVPWFGLFSVSIEKIESPSRPSASVASSTPVISWSSIVCALISPVILAASSAFSMLMDITWFVVPPLSSLTVTVNESTPLKSGLGLYSQSPVLAFILADPWAGNPILSIENIEGPFSPSASIALIVPAADSSSRVDPDIFPVILVGSSSLATFIVIFKVFSDIGASPPFTDASMILPDSGITRSDLFS